MNIHNTTIDQAKEQVKREKRKAYNDNYYRKNRDKIIRCNTDYYNNNKENASKAFKKRYYNRTPEEFKQASEERKLRYSLRSPEEIQTQKERDNIRKLNLSPEKIQQSKDYHKRRYRERKEAIVAYNKEHNKKEEVIQRRKERNKLRRETDTNFKIAGILRDRLYRGLKSKGINKTISAIELVGCDIPTLKQHIEMQFLPGMSWNNYNHSTWHVDHIKPVNTFDLTDIEQQKICFHYTNLRPLWAKDNLSRPDNGSDIIY